MRDGGVTFSVKDQDFDNIGNDFESAEDVFDPETLMDSVNFNAAVDEDHSAMPFEAIKEKMTNVTPNGSVKKRVSLVGLVPLHCLPTGLLYHVLFFLSRF